MRLSVEEGLVQLPHSEGQRLPGGNIQTQSPDPRDSPHGSTASRAAGHPALARHLAGHLGFWDTCPNFPAHGASWGGGTDPMGSLIPRGPTSQKGKPRPKPELGGVLPARPPSVTGPLSLLRWFPPSRLLLAVKALERRIRTGTPHVCRAPLQGRLLHPQTPAQQALHPPLAL